MSFFFIQSDVIFFLQESASEEKRKLPKSDEPLRKFVAVFGAKRSRPVELVK